MLITALLTCFNRRQQTIDCLRSIFSLRLPSGCQLGVVLVDDGSTDGTGEAVRKAFPGVKVPQGDGNLYWNGGMRLAWSHAVHDDPDYYLLANDDTVLGTAALTVLLGIAGSPDALRIAVGAISDPDTGNTTYGGWRRAGGPTLIGASGRVERCDTFNANFVLIPRAVFNELGMFHDAYTHAVADHDYGYQATRRGIEVLQSPGFVGTCKPNFPTESWRDRSLTRVDRFRRLNHIKAHPWREMVAFHRRNSGWLWPWRCITPYLRILLGR